jgi:UDPglucose 6-dehydrogenase
MSRVGVVGAGYVGLTTGACLAHLGHEVVVGDIDVDKVNALAKGEVSVLEEGLPELVADGLTTRRLRFVVGAPDAAADAEFVFLCVPTPAGKDGDADLSAVHEVIEELAPVLRVGTVLVNKSTMPVGSSVLVARLLRAAGAVPDVGVASNPEFLREGSCVRDFLQPARVVIGADDQTVAVRVSELYRDVQAPVLVTSAASAEMIKYASNAFLAAKVSFVNAIANLCEAVNADVREVTLGMGYDPRIGFEFLHPGPGWGGSCFPKDTAALARTAAQVGDDFPLLAAVIQTNTAQRARVLQKIEAAAGGSLAGQTLAVWGLTFKANTNDLRDSPAIDIVRRLVDAGAAVRAYDPAGGEAATDLVPGLEVVADPYDACSGARALCLLTEWDEFRWLDYERVGQLLTRRAVVDARNLLDPAAMRHLGYVYEGVGR